MNAATNSSPNRNAVTQLIDIADFLAELGSPVARLAFGHGTTSRPARRRTDPASTTQVMAVVS